MAPFLDCLKFLGCHACLLMLPIQCECPGHKKHVKDFIKKNPGADGIFGIVDVEPGEWLANLDNPEKNTAHWCQLMRYFRGYYKNK